jgi:hypothetical protein
MLLQGYPVPEELFDALLFKTKDKFSWIVDDYLELEGQIQGTTKNNGVEFGLKYRPGSTTNIFGYVRYIINNSDAYKILNVRCFHRCKWNTIDS